MATPVVIDTNLYVCAEREPEVRDTLRGFLRDVSTRVVVSTVALHELLVGATPVMPNARDFDIIAKVYGVRYLTHFPE